MFLCAPLKSALWVPGCNCSPEESTKPRNQAGSAADCSNPCLSKLPSERELHVNKRHGSPLICAHGAAARVRISFRLSKESSQPRGIQNISKPPLPINHSTHVFNTLITPSNLTLSYSLLDSKQSQYFKDSGFQWWHPAHEHLMQHVKGW